MVQNYFHQGAGRYTIGPLVYIYIDTKKARIESGPCIRKAAVINF